MGHRSLHGRIRVDIDQIAVGNDADHILSIDDNQMVDVVAAEQLPSRGGGVGRADGANLLVHDVSYSHAQQCKSAIRRCPRSRVVGFCG